MYIFALRIQNFRSFKDVWLFPNKSLNCIIGPNNSGKSTLIDALSITLDYKAPSYRDDFITQFDFHDCNTDNPIIIDIWLDKHQTENDDIQTKTFDKFSRWTIVKYPDEHPEKMDPVVAEPLEDAPAVTAPILELLRIQFTATWDESTKSAEHKTAIVNELGEVVEPFSISLRKLIGFSSIPSNREPLRDISLSKKGVFSHFLDDNIINPHFRNLIGELEKNKSGLLDSSGIKQVVERLKKIVAAQVVGNLTGQHDDAVSITFLNSEIGKLRAESCFSIKVGSKPATETQPAKSIHVPLEYQGDGIQNLFLIITLAEIIKQQTGTDHCIVALEEPEQHLEPSQVKWVYSELCKCFNSIGTGANHNQLFISTHSPALVGEIKGADSLVIMPAERINTTPIRIVNASYIKPEIKKSFERYRDSYTDALLAKYILFVEGLSELGFLPVAFRQISTDACDNPFHLGLEIVNGQDKESALKRGEEMLSFNRPVHVLIDHDQPTRKCNKTTEQLLTEYSQKDLHISSWAQSDLITFTTGADLEIVLVKDVSPDILLEAIKEAYRDPCHEFDQNEWNNECDKISDTTLKDKIKAIFPRDANSIQFANTLTTLNDKQAYLFVLLHAPHSCKSVKDMRIIAEYLASKNTIPESVKLLHNRILAWITKRDSISKQDYVVKTTNGN